jgi:hypothetical protein
MNISTGEFVEARGRRWLVDTSFPGVLNGIAVRQNGHDDF